MTISPPTRKNATTLTSCPRGRKGPAPAQLGAVALHRLVGLPSLPLRLLIRRPLVLLLAAKQVKKPKEQVKNRSRNRSRNPKCQKQTDKADEQSISEGARDLDAQDKRVQTGRYFYTERKSGLTGALRGALSSVISDLATNMTIKSN